MRWGRLVRGKWKFEEVNDAIASRLAFLIFPRWALA
jgi:hypothetical protein